MIDHATECNRPNRWQLFACAENSIDFLFQTSTKTGNVVLTAEGAYPHFSSVYTIRTPSPDGQQDAVVPAARLFFAPLDGLPPGSTPCCIAPFVDPLHTSAVPQ